MNMPLELKIFLTWAILLFCIMFAGISTIGNITAQEILKPLALGWMVIGPIAGLFYMWREL
ncbi:hypothetical protein LCGC14_0887140 [marine sediment metagenome]|uniref:Uncharacterized protein n=1 Tax=marine sediment metagenome TaxID=412755 RepID=A0A0F9S751_9ZZZZ